MRSAKISYNGEEVDLCLCRTKATFSQEGSTRILTLDPVDIEFYDLTVKLQTKIYFEEGSSKIRHERTILEMSNPDAEVEINEYMVACYGTTEYPEDMTGMLQRASHSHMSTSAEKRISQVLMRCQQLSLRSRQRLPWEHQAATQQDISKRDMRSRQCSLSGLQRHLRIRRYFQHGSVWKRQIKLQMSNVFYERSGYRYVL